MLFAVTGLLLPSRLQSPSSCPVETIAAPERGNGAERNRTAVRNTGVDHLVRSRPDIVILTAVVKRSIRFGEKAATLTTGHSWRCSVAPGFRRDRLPGVAGTWSQTGQSPATCGIVRIRHGLSLQTSPAMSSALQASARSSTLPLRRPRFASHGCAAGSRLGTLASPIDELPGGCDRYCSRAESQPLHRSAGEKRLD